MSTTVESTTPKSRAQSAAGKFLAFSLAQELYGIAVLKVREIIKLVPITAVPQMPAHVKGVINLRGRIIPVIDLGMRFGMSGASATDRVCIIVVQVLAVSGAHISLGLIVDSVEEVFNIAAPDIEETPDFGTSVDTTCLLGMAKVKNRVVSLLDIDRVVGSEIQKALPQEGAGEIAHQN